jgi:hypothetical protein
MAKRKPKPIPIPDCPEGSCIYIIRNGLQKGPYSIDQINSFLDDRSLKTYDLAWYEGLTAWILVKDLQGVTLPDEEGSGSTLEFKKQQNNLQIPRGHFTYIALDAQGKEIRDNIKASNQTEAINLLRKKGLFPTSVKGETSTEPVTATAGSNNYSPKTNSMSLSEFNEKSPLAIPALCIVVLFGIILPMCSSGSKKSDGVYESATEKIDKGIPLNKIETKRIETIMGYKADSEAKEIEHRNGEN